MVKYSREPEAGAAIKTAKARASDLRTSFKNMRETAMAIKNMPLAKARAYLNRVLEHKSCVPLRRFNGSAGRTPLTKEHNFSGPGRFPEKSVKHLLDLLTNAESNAEGKELDSDNLHITHIQVRVAFSQAQDRSACVLSLLSTQPTGSHRQGIPREQTHERGADGCVKGGGGENVEGGGSWRLVGCEGWTCADAARYRWLGNR